MEELVEFRLRFASCRLGGHLKTDHRGSLQNRPTDVTLDKNLFYLTGCLCGNPSFDLVRSDSGVGLMPGGVIHLQNLVPIVGFLRRKVSLESQIRPSPLGSNACHCQAKHIHQQSTRFVGIECRYDLGGSEGVTRFVSLPGSAKDQLATVCSECPAKNKGLNSYVLESSPVS